MTRVLAVASEKDGESKTNVVANLVFAHTKLPKNVLVMDADLSLESLNILLGWAPLYTLAHLFLGAKSLGEIIIEGPGGMRILPASSGVQQPRNLSTEQKSAFLAEIDRFDETGDVMLIDTGPGIAGNLLYFAIAAQEITGVMCPEPMAIASACGCMKVLACEHGHRKFQLLVNAVATAHEREMVFQTLQLTTQQSLDIEIYLPQVDSARYSRRESRQTVET
jgi:flagellar biosynthesis protein FlhG